MSEAVRAAENAARTSYGRLLALLARDSRDIAAAEDALAEALAAALATWPERGVPANPDAWLFTAARRNLGHARARAATAGRGEATLTLIEDERAGSEAPAFADAAPQAFSDERLKLLFVCTHPAIAAEAQAPLMLQTVLGLDAARIAASFLVTPAAMGQKLVRAKARIKGAGIAFTIPAAEQLPGRLAAVRAAIYAAYGTGWEAVSGADAKARDLAPEALWLARLLCDLAPDDAENHGLLALMLYCEARRAARRSAEGDFVPLLRQDPQRWDAAMLAEAESRLRTAATLQRPGRYQLEAAIQSLHNETVLTGTANRPGLIGLYDMLLAVAPSIGAEVARAAALAEDSPQAALAALGALADRCASYQPWWAARARALHLAGEAAAASEASARAAGLSRDPAVRRWLLGGGLTA